MTANRFENCINSFTKIKKLLRSDESGVRVAGCSSAGAWRNKRDENILNPSRRYVFRSYVYTYVCIFKILYRSPIIMMNESANFIKENWNANLCIIRNSTSSTMILQLRDFQYIKKNNQFDLRVPRMSKKIWEQLILKYKNLFKDLLSSDKDTKYLK